MKKFVIPAAMAACAALVFVPALSAAAVVDSQSWTSATDQWWTTPGSWSSGEAPEAGDTLVFSGTGASARSTKHGAISLAGIQFTSSHEVANDGGDLTLGTGGLTTAPGTTVSIDSNIETTGAQTWSVGTGSTATFPGVIRTDGSALTLDVDGTMNVNGNLDALGTGSIIKTGSGTIVRTGGAGGGIGNGGLSVQEGTFFLAGGTIGGTAFTVAGGSLTGLGTANSINLSSGVIAPGGSDGSGVATLIATGPSTWSGGTYSATIDGSSGGDLFNAVGHTLDISATALDLRLESVPVVGTPTPVAVASVLTGRFTSGGVVLDDGAEFASNGYRYSISYTEVPNAVIVTYLGPVPVIPQAPAPTPLLPATGAPFNGMLGAGAVMLLLTGGVLVFGRRRTASL